MTNHYQDPYWTTSHTTKIFVQQPLWKDTVGGFDHCATGSPKNPSISYIFESTRFQGQWKTRVPVHIFHRYRRKPEGHGHGRVRNDVVQHIGTSWWWKFASPNYKRCESSQIYRPKTYQKGLSDQGEKFPRYLHHIFHQTTGVGLFIGKICRKLRAVGGSAELSAVESAFQQMAWDNSTLIQVVATQIILIFMFTPPKKMWKWSNLTSIFFQMGWLKPPPSHLPISFRYFSVIKRKFHEFKTVEGFEQMMCLVALLAKCGFERTALDTTVKVFLVSEEDWEHF